MGDSIEKIINRSKYNGKQKKNVLITGENKWTRSNRGIKLNKIKQNKLRRKKNQFQMNIEEKKRPAAK